MVVKRTPLPVIEPQTTASAYSGRGWMLLLILALALLPHVTLYALNSPSTAFRVVAVGFAGLAVGSAVVAGWGLRGLPRVETIRAWAARWQTPYIVGAVLVCVGFGVLMRPEWVYAHTGLLLALLLTLVYSVLFHSAPRLSRRGWFAIGAGVVVATLLRIYALSYYPIYNILDEGWILGWVLSYIRTGQFFDTINYYGGADVQRFMLPVAWWVSVFGPGFWQTRLFFFLCTMLVIGLGGLAARNLYRSPWITMLVMFSSAVVMSGARLRHDVGLGLAIAAAIWLWSAAVKRDKAWLHLLAGLMIGLGMFAHYHASFMGVALMFGLYFPRWIRSKRLLPERGLILFGVGGLIGLVLVIALQIIPDWQGFIAVRGVRRPLSLLDYVGTFFAHINNLIGHSQYEFLLIALAFGAALWRRTALDVALIIVLIIAHVGLAAFASSPPVFYYVVPLGVVYSLLVAGLFERVLTWERGGRQWMGAACLLSVGLGYTLGQPVFLLRQGAPVDLPPPPAVAWVRANVTTDELVVAENFYYLFLNDYPFASPLTPEYMHLPYRAQFEEATLTLDVSTLQPERTGMAVSQYTFRAAVWDEIAPDVVIIDHNLSTCCVPPILDSVYLEARGYELVATLEGESQPILIYRKNES